MLKRILEKRLETLNNNEFKHICNIVTDDIKFNRIAFKKYTSLSDLVEIFQISIVIIKKRGCNYVD